MSNSNRSTKKKSVSTLNNRVKTINIDMPYLDLTGLVETDKPYIFYFQGSFYDSEEIATIGRIDESDNEFEDIITFLCDLPSKELENPDLYRAVADFLEMLKSKGIITQYNK